MALPFKTPAPFKTNEKRDKWLANKIKVKDWQAVSGRNMLKAIRGAGIKIRDNTFWGIRREVLGLQKWEEAIKSLNPGNIVPKHMMVVNSKVSLAKQAQYRFTATMTDLATGDESTIFRAISTDQQLTPNQTTAALDDLFEEPSANSNYLVKEIELYQVWIREDAKLT